MKISYKMPSLLKGCCKVNPSKTAELAIATTVFKVHIQEDINKISMYNAKGTRELSTELVNVSLE
jgi:hypothetical protein